MNLVLTPSLKRIFMDHVKALRYNRVFIITFLLTIVVLATPIGQKISQHEIFFGLAETFIVTLGKICVVVIGLLLCRGVWRAYIEAIPHLQYLDSGTCNIL